MGQVTLHVYLTRVCGRQRICREFQTSPKRDNGNSKWFTAPVCDGHDLARLAAEIKRLAEGGRFYLGRHGVREHAY